MDQQTGSKYIHRPKHREDKQSQSLKRPCRLDIFINYKVNSLAPGRFEWNYKYVIPKLILVIGGLVIPGEIAQRQQMLLYLNDDKST